MSVHKKLILQMTENLASKYDKEFGLGSSVFQFSLTT